MRVFIVYIIIAMLAISLQSTIFPHIKPDLALILVCLYSLRGGEIRGMVLGAIVGLLIDSVSGFIIGPNILSKSIVGFLFNIIRQKFFFWNAFLNTLMVAIFSIIDTFIVRITLEAFLGVSFSSMALKTAIIAVLYTTMAGLIAYLVFKPKVL
ncbi:MAG: hypothetical protein Fur0020_06980 [Thermodesulfovibrionia bacterium]